MNDNPLIPTLEDVEVQHRQLFVLFERLQASAGPPASGDCGTPGALLDELRRAIRVHFDSEELLMDYHDYPQFSGHKWQHEILYQEITLLCAATHAVPQLSTEALAVLRKVIHEHTDETDSDFVDYLQTRTGETR
jgi:hemerythrin